MAGKPPLRYQFYALGGILLFTAAIGGTVYGVRAVGTWSFVEPACEKACMASGAHFADVDFRVGKRDHQSLCLCTNGASVPSPDADTIATLSALAPIGLALLVTIVGITVMARRSRRA